MSQATDVRHPEWPEPYQNHMTIIEAAEALGVKYPNYVRTLLLPGKNGKAPKIAAVKLQQAGSKRQMWAIDPDSVQDYADHRGEGRASFGGGRPGKRRFILKVDTSVTPYDEESLAADLKEALGDAFIEVEKPKSYYKSKTSGEGDESDEDHANWELATLETLVPDAIDSDEDEDDESGMDL